MTLYLYSAYFFITTLCCIGLFIIIPHFLISDRGTENLFCI